MLILDCERIERTADTRIVVPLSWVYVTDSDGNLIASQPKRN